MDEAFEEGGGLGTTSRQAVDADTSDAGVASVGESELQAFVARISGFILTLSGTTPVCHTTLVVRLAEDMRCAATTLAKVFADAAQVLCV